MTYIIEGLDPAPFLPLFSLGKTALAERGIAVVTADDADYPCRISLQGAALGDRLLLLSYLHQSAHSPYRSSHAIYVAQGSIKTGIYRDHIPSVMVTRLLSIRAFDATDMMIDADVIDGTAAESLIVYMLANPKTAYLHVHFAKRGCFFAKIKRD